MLNITVKDQGQIFFFSLLFGAFLSIVYDIFRIPRLIRISNDNSHRCLKKQNVINNNMKRGILFFQDVLYFFICGVFTFLFCLVINKGELRFFIVAGELVGWILYNITLGKLTVFICMFVYKFLQKIYIALKKVLFKILKPLLRFVKNKYPCVELKILNKNKNQKKSKNLLKFKNSLVYNMLKRFKRKKKHSEQKTISG